MKFICLTRIIKEVVNIAERNTAKNQTLPVLNSILLIAENNKIKIRATNLETAIEVYIPCKVESVGSVVVPAKSISSFLSNITDEQVTFQDQKGNLLVKTSKTQTIIKGYQSEDFPLFPKIESNTNITLSSTDLKNSLSSVVIASSISDIKPELASVCIKIFKNNIKFIATDSFRLAEKTIVLKNMSNDTLTSILVPQKSILEILRIIDKPVSGKEENIKIGFNKNQFIVTDEHVCFISRLTEGVFPDYEQIIPKNFKTEAVAKSAEMINHIKLSSVFVGRLNDLTLKFNSQKKSINFYASNPDIGEHTSEMEVAIQGEDTSAKYNWKYLFDGISQIKSEYAVFNVSGDQTPLLIKGKGDMSYVYLVMPMRGL